MVAVGRGAGPERLFVELDFVFENTAANGGADLAVAQRQGIFHPRIGNARLGHGYVVPQRIVAHAFGARACLYRVELGIERSLVGLHLGVGAENLQFVARVERAVIIIDNAGSGTAGLLHIDHVVAEFHLPGIGGIACGSKREGRRGRVFIRAVALHILACADRIKIFVAFHCADGQLLGSLGEICRAGFADQGTACEFVGSGGVEQEAACAAHGIYLAVFKTCVGGDAVEFLHVCVERGGSRGFDDLESVAVVGSIPGVNHYTLCHAAGSLHIDDVAADLDGPRVGAVARLGERDGRSGFIFIGAVAAYELACTERVEILVLAVVEKHKLLRFRREAGGAAARGATGNLGRIGTLGRVEKETACAADHVDLFAANRGGARDGVARSVHCRHFGTALPEEAKQQAEKR